MYSLCPRHQLLLLLQVGIHCILYIYMHSLSFLNSNKQLSLIKPFLFSNSQLSLFLENFKGCSLQAVSACSYMPMQVVKRTLLPTMIVGENKFQIIPVLLGLHIIHNNKILPTFETSSISYMLFRHIMVFFVLLVMLLSRCQWGEITKSFVIFTLHQTTSHHFLPHQKPC